MATSKASLTLHQSSTPLETEGEAALPEPLGRVQQLLAEGKAQQALDLLAPKYSGSIAMQNARGVCLLRLGRADNAVRVLRSAFLVSGGLTFREDIADVYLVNFAVALAMTGQVSGAVGVLRSLKNPQIPAAVELRSAIRDWERQLSWPAWLLWKGGIEQNRPWTSSFLPGHLAGGE